MNRPLAILSLLLAVSVPALATAHEMRPGYLEIRESAPGTFDVLWKVPARGENQRLALYLRFADDVKVLTEPVTGFTRGAHVQRLRIGRQGGLTGTVVTIDGLERTYTDVLLRLERADGTTQTHRLTPDAPSYMIEALPGPGQVAWTYAALGMEHILSGVDHLLFVLALLLIVSGWRRLVGTITAFTVAHSITLALSALGFVHIPGPPVEAVIALSIVFVAAEIRARSVPPSTRPGSGWCSSCRKPRSSIENSGLPRRPRPPARRTTSSIWPPSRVRPWRCRGRESARRTSSRRGFAARKIRSHRLGQETSQRQVSRP